MDLETLALVSSIIGGGSIVNFFIQRYFSRKDEATRQTIKKQQEAQTKRDLERARKEEEREARERLREKEYQELYAKVDKGLETIRLLSYARVAEEADRLLTQKYATPAERRYMYELNENYKQWGWNGDMRDRMHKVANLPDAPLPEEAQ